MTLWEVRGDIPPAIGQHPTRFRTGVVRPVPATIQRMPTDVSQRRGPRRSSVGGSGNEAGSEYRAGVAAWLVVLGLDGRDVEGLGFGQGDAVPMVVTLETDHPIDDLNIRLSGGGRLLAQAKRSVTLGGEAFRSTAAQWVTAIKEAQIDPIRDRLVLLTEGHSRQVAALASALDRLRKTDPGAATIDEQDALTTLKDLLTSLDEDGQHLLLSVAAVLQVQILGSNAPHRVSALSIIETSVVASGEGQAAFAALQASARVAAIARHGRVLREWRIAIEEAGLHLRTDLTGSPAARATAIDSLLDRYREDMVRAGTQLDLLPLGITVAPIALSEPASGWRVIVPTEDEGPGERELGPAIRRRGRVVLLGPPGAGKSSALIQQAGSWASDATEPIPIVVPLNKLPRNSPSDLHGLVRLGSFVPDEERVVAELVSRLEHGEAVLFLDGLDECRDRRFEVVALVRRLIRSVDAGSDVVLSTRDVAYAAAETLGWAPLTLTQPSDMEEVLASVAAALAQRESIPDEERISWVATRLRWLESAREENKAIGETPLLLVLTLALLAKQSPATLPKTRARLLSEIIDDAAERLEIRVRQASVQWPNHQRHEVIGLLREGFDFIGHAVFDAGEIGREDLVVRLSAEVGRSWGFTSSRAAVVAAEIVDFWDEASVFTAGGSPPAIRGRVRSLVDLAEARYSSRQESSEITRWASRLADEPTASDALLLGAGLSEAIAMALLREAVRRPADPVALTACTAIERGAAFDPALVHELAAALSERVRAAPAVGVVKALARLPVGLDLREQVRATLEGIPDEQIRAMAVGIAMVRWDVPPEESESALRRALTTPPPAILVDEGWVEAVTGAADLLLGAGIDVDDALLITFRKVSMDADRRLDAVLRRHGRADLVDRAHADRSLSVDIAQVERRIAAGDAAWGIVFDHLASRNAAELSSDQARRLHELADLIASLEILESPATWFDRASHHSADLPPMLDLAVTLGGFDGGVLSSEASVASGLRRLDATTMLADNAMARPLSRWDLVADVEAARIELVRLMSSGPLFARFATKALATAPDAGGVLRGVEPGLSRLDVESRLMVARLVLHLHRAEGRLLEWLDSSDAALRTSAGRVVGIRWAANDLPRSVLEAALLSPDAAVRSITERALAGREMSPPAELADQMRHRPSDGWDCMWCGARNVPDREDCQQCHVVGNQTVQRAARHPPDYFDVD